MPYLVWPSVIPEHDATAANILLAQTTVNKTDKNKILLKNSLLTILFFGIFFRAYIVNRPAQSNLIQSRDISHFTGQNTEEIYQKKKTVKRFLIFQKCFTEYIFIQFPYACQRRTRPHIRNKKTSLDFKQAF